MLNETPFCFESYPQSRQIRFLFEATERLETAVSVKAAVIAGSTITRPADTTPYASGDLLANSASAGSVVAGTFAGTVSAAGGFIRVETIRLQKSGTGVTGGSFRIHLFSATPGTVINGDNGVFSMPRAGYVGAVDVTVDRPFSDGAAGSGIPTTGTARLITIPAGTTLFYLVEVRGAYTPISGETFTPTLEGYRF